MVTAKRGRQAREIRMVRRVEMAVGPQGGRYFVLHLECGHVVERRWMNKAAPRSVRCGWCKVS